METSWGRANPSSDKPKLARIELVFIFEMVLTFETSTTEGRSGGAVCVLFFDIVFIVEVIFNFEVFFDVVFFFEVVFIF